MDTGTNAALNISACRLLNRCVGISYFSNQGDRTLLGQHL